jgi:hypothetical protein
MKRHYVKSSFLKSVGYDKLEEILEAEFKSGDIYRYHNVPVTVYEEFISSESLGEYLNSKIKAGYKFVKVN